MRFFVVCATLILASGCSPSGDTPTPLVLTDTSLGPLSLRPESIISIHRLEQIFPAHRVTHAIRSGDSPDYHYFEVAADDGEVLFTISSFLQQGQQLKDPNSVRIDLLKVISPRIADGHGLRVGDRVADIVRARGTNLQFGAAHFDVYLGADSIFYNIRTSGQSSPDRLTFDDAARENWAIISISWPGPAWE